MDLSLHYQKILCEYLAKVSEANRPVLAAVGEKIGQSITQGGLLHVFGVGHNDHIAAASTNRPHGLAPVSLIVHSGKNWLDTISGYGEGLVKHHHFNYELLAGEVVVVVSDSGTDRILHKRIELGIGVIL